MTLDCRSPVMLEHIYLMLKWALPAYQTTQFIRVLLGMSGLMLECIITRMPNSCLSGYCEAAVELHCIVSNLAV